jgi:hypothetical protein
MTKGKIGNKYWKLRKTNGGKGPLGYKQTQEHIKKRFSNPNSQIKRIETRKKNGWFKNRDEFCEKMKSIVVNEYKKGKKSFFADKRFIPRNVSMENNPNWHNGSSFKLYSFDWKNTLKESIRQRDNFKCKICNKLQEENTRKLDVHHIDYNKQNCNPDNLITLCMQCHRKTQINRDYWIDYFKRLLK